MMNLAVFGAVWVMHSMKLPSTEVDENALQWIAVRSASDGSAPRNSSVIETPKPQV